MSYRAKYVCDYRFSAYAPALADCDECGWPIGRHLPEPFEDKGPFAPPVQSPLTLDDVRRIVREELDAWKHEVKDPPYHESQERS